MPHPSGHPSAAAMAEEEEVAFIDNYPAWVRAMDEDGRPLAIEALSLIHI